MHSDFNAAVCWRAVHFPPGKKIYMYLSSINTIIGQMPKLVAFVLYLLYKLVILVARNVPLRERGRPREGTGNSGTKCEEAAEKIN